MPDYWQTPEKATMRKAAAMCNSCPALQACAKYARVAAEPTGVWGGTLPGRRMTVGR
ncbi:WhiB family transcriptional regulator [Saxibacter everestensis]|uniref:WhiB family transcriptional regulator n=1 Tax=Saxibacter everestensis TaxID=2909229 RepID=UPI003D80A599